METIEMISAGAAPEPLLRARFFRQGDRYAHQVELVDGQRETVLLSSCEGADHASWPPSPVLQQLTVGDHRGGDRVLLLVGQAGRSHWSMSVETAQSATALTFDVACRVQQEPEWLGSSYQWESPLDVTVAADRADIGPPATPCRLLVEPGDAADATAATTEMAGDRRLQVAAALAPGPLPRTVRWKYRVEIVG